MEGDTPPWRPVLMQFEVAHNSIYDIIHEPELLYDIGVWSADGDIVPLRLAGDSPEETYSGTVFLSDHGTQGFVDALKAFRTRAWPDGRMPTTRERAARSNAERPLVDLAATLQPLLDLVETGMPQLSQGLNGLSHGLLMHEQVLQMAVVDPFASAPRRELTADIARALAGQTWLSPLPRQRYTPIDGGLLRLKRLRLIDSFGRFVDYHMPNVAIARRLRSSEALANTAVLPARIAQPCRLLFHWGKPDAPVPASPVLGWLIVNDVDGSLVFYDGEGRVVSCLAASEGADGGAVRWSPPDSGSTPDPLLEKLIASLHQGEAGKGRFATFRERLARALEFVRPASAVGEGSLAVLIGRPLAIVRAGVSLDLNGAPAIDQSWPAFAARLRTGQSVEASQFSDIMFPVVFSKARQLDDGLVGYWLDDGEQPDFTRLFVPSEAEDGSLALDQPSSHPDEGIISVRAGDREPVGLTLLMDPRGALHASTGILPVKSAVLPPEFYAEALARLRVTFETSAVLAAASSSVDAPVGLVEPRYARGRWTWRLPDGRARRVRDLADAPVDFELDRRDIIDGWMQLDDLGS